MTGSGVSWPPAPEGAGACGSSGEEGGAWAGTSGIATSLDTTGAGGDSTRVCCLISKIAQQHQAKQVNSSKKTVQKKSKAI